MAKQTTSVYSYRSLYLSVQSVCVCSNIRKAIAVENESKTIIGNGNEKKRCGKRQLRKVLSVDCFYFCSASVNLSMQLSVCLQTESVLNSNCSQQVMMQLLSALYFKFRQNSVNLINPAIQWSWPLQWVSSNKCFGNLRIEHLFRKLIQTDNCCGEYRLNSNGDYNQSIHFSILLTFGRWGIDNDFVIIS